MKNERSKEAWQIRTGTGETERKEIDGRSNGAG